VNIRLQAYSFVCLGKGTTWSLLSSAKTSWPSPRATASRFAELAAKRTLMVEGPDDMHVLRHLCMRRGVPDFGEIKPHDGLEHLLESFPVRLKASEEGDIVGVVVDADTDTTARWHSIRDRLIELHFEGVPSSPV